MQSGREVNSSGAHRESNYISCQRYIGAVSVPRTWYFAIEQSADKVRAAYYHRARRHNRQANAVEWIAR